MEYKLKKSEFYRVAYLVAGILMFLFLFGIFNLSSYASSGTFHGWYAQENVQNDSYISFLQNFNVNDFTCMENPAFNHTWNIEITKTPVSGYSDSNITVNFILHVVTSNGDQIIGTFISPDSGSYVQSFSGSGTCFGVPTYAYIEVIASSEWARIAGNYQITSWSFNVSPFDFGSSDLFFSDYSSYSPLTLMNNVQFRSDYSDGIISAGSPMLFSFSNLNTTSLNFSPKYLTFNLGKGHQKVLVTFIYDNTSSSPTSSFNFNVLHNNVSTNYGLSDFNYIRSYTDGTNYRWVFYKFFEFDITNDLDLVYMVLQGSSPSPITSFNFMGYQYKGTISDYMNYVQSQWSNISPNVTQTNANIADSVSTVGSASTYEAAQFTSFDNLVTQTGVDSFSLSTVSTPLLWVGGLITTCYNNLPSAIQYLLMFVGVFGLIVIILNSSSRVIRRFGGDS